MGWIVVTPQSGEDCGEVLGEVCDDCNPPGGWEGLYVASRRYTLTSKLYTGQYINLSMKIQTV